MENIMESAYVNYEGRIQIDSYIIVISLWNRFIEDREGNGYGSSSKVSMNDKAFFDTNFENSYDAAQAVSAGDYRWTDEFVYFDNEGHLMSFSLLDDVTCPIDLERIAIDSLIRELQELEDLEKGNKKGYVNNIPRAIHDALQEV